MTTATTARKQGASASDLLRAALMPLSRPAPPRVLPVPTPAIPGWNARIGGAA